MSTFIRVTLVVALLTIAAFSALLLPHHLPTRFRLSSGGEEFTLVLGGVAWLLGAFYLAALATPRVGVREAFASRYRLVFLGSVLLVIGYVVLVAIAVIDMIRSGDY